MFHGKESKSKWVQRMLNEAGRKDGKDSNGAKGKAKIFFAEAAEILWHSDLGCRKLRSDGRKTHPCPLARRA